MFSAKYTHDATIIAPFKIETTDDNEKAVIDDINMLISMINNAPFAKLDDMLTQEDRDNLAKIKNTENVENDQVRSVKALSGRFLFSRKIEQRIEFVHMLTEDDIQTTDKRGQALFIGQRGAITDMFEKHWQKSSEDIKLAMRNQYQELLKEIEELKNYVHLTASELAMVSILIETILENAGNIRRELTTKETQLAFDNLVINLNAQKPLIAKTMSKYLDLHNSNNLRNNHEVKGCNDLVYYYKTRLISTFNKDVCKEKPGCVEYFDNTLMSTISDPINKNKESITVLEHFRKYCATYSSGQSYWSYLNPFTMLKHLGSLLYVVATGSVGYLSSFTQSMRNWSAHITETVYADYGKSLQSDITDEMSGIEKFKREINSDSNLDLESNELKSEKANELDGDFVVIEQDNDTSHQALEDDITESMKKIDNLIGEINSDPALNRKVEPKAKIDEDFQPNNSGGSHLATDDEKLKERMRLWVNELTSSINRLNLEIAEVNATHNSSCFSFFSTGEKLKKVAKEKALKAVKEEFENQIQSGSLNMNIVIDKCKGYLDNDRIVICGFTSRTKTILKAIIKGDEPKSLPWNAKTEKLKAKQEKFKAGDVETIDTSFMFRRCA